MTRREERVIRAFIGCVKSGEFTEDYACILIEDVSKYGFLSGEAKEAFYDALEPAEEIEGTAEYSPVPPEILNN